MKNCGFHLSYDCRSLDLDSFVTYDAWRHSLMPSLPVLNCCSHIIPSENHLIQIICNCSQHLSWSSQSHAKSFHLTFVSLPWHSVVTHMCHKAKPTESDVSQCAFKHGLSHSPSVVITIYRSSPR